MISVIIPTLWKSSELGEMLPILEKNNFIREILIIDNAPKDRHIDIPESKKIKILQQDTNIFVNPAWNLGVEKAKYDKLCIMSDDIKFDERVFEFVYEHITEDNGVIGPNGKGIKNFYVRSLAMEINPANNIQHWDGFGTLMFIHKKNYLPIPKDFLIYWGDAWLYDFNAVQGRQNYTLDKFCIKTTMRTTSGMFTEITDKELEVYDKVFDKMYKKYKNTENYLSSPMANSIHELIIQSL